jgi:hypothetical protein
MGIAGRPPLEHLADGEELLDGRLLQHDPDALQHAPAVVARVEAEHRDAAGVRGLVAL